MKSIFCYYVLGIVFLFNSCSTFSYKQITIIESKKEYDITYKFKMLNKNLRNFKQENIIVSLIFSTSNIDDIRDIYVTFEYDDKKVEHIFKTNYPNKFIINKTKMLKKLHLVKCYVEDVDKKMDIDISYFIYSIEHGIVHKPYFQINLRKKILKKNFLDYDNFITVDENVLVDNRFLKNIALNDYLEFCKRIKSILKNEYDWIFQWNIYFVLDHKVLNHYYPINYFYIYFLPAYINLNPLTSQSSFLRNVLHEILEASIIVSFDLETIKSRFIHDGIPLYIEDNILMEIDKILGISNVYEKCYEIMEIKTEKINLLNKKFTLSSSLDSKYYYASQYFWEKLVDEYNLNLKELFNTFRKSRSFSEYDYITVLKLISEQINLPFLKVEQKLVVDVNEMKEFYKNKYGFDDKYNEMVYVNYISRFPDNISSVHLFMDKYEVSNVKYCIFLNETGNQKEEGVFWYNGDDIFQDENGDWKVKEGMENIPVVNITYYGAEAYAKWAGKRLPTLYEWKVAAGKGMFPNTMVQFSEPPNSKGEDLLNYYIEREMAIRTYPWGNEWDPTKCNWNDGGKYDGYDGLAPVNSFPDGKSAFGGYNMVGNAFEFVKKGEEENFQRHVGGAYKYGMDLNNLNSFAWGLLNDYYYTVSFRCVKDIEF